MYIIILCGAAFNKDVFKLSLVLWTHCIKNAMTGITNVWNTRDNIIVNNLIGIYAGSPFYAFWAIIEEGKFE